MPTTIVNQVSVQLDAFRKDMREDMDKFRREVRELLDRDLLELRGRVGKLETDASSGKTWAIEEHQKLYLQVTELRGLIIGLSDDVKSATRQIGIGQQRTFQWSNSIVGWIVAGFLALASLLSSHIVFK